MLMRLVFLWFYCWTCNFTAHEESPIRSREASCFLFWERGNMKTAARIGKPKTTANLILLLLTYSNIFNSLKNLNNRDTQHGKEIICCHSYAVCPLTIDVETRSGRTTTNTTAELWWHYFRCDQRTGMPSGDYLQRGDLIIEAQCF